MADEIDFYELMMANERISGWLEDIQNKDNSKSRTVSILQELKASIQDNPLYIDEANKLGISGRLVSLIKQGDDEEITNLCEKIISFCSRNPSSQTKDIKIYNFNIKIHEMSLNEGFGSQVWVSAMILSRYLVDNQQLVHNMNVLEIGSGCGLCGLVASKLGALQVILTDYEAMVLENLQKCMELNSDQPNQKFLEAHNVGKDAKYEQGTMQRSQHRDNMQNPLSSDQMAKTESIFSGGSLRVEAHTVASEQEQDLEDTINDQQQFVDYDNIQLRYMDWKDSVKYVDKQKQPQNEIQSKQQEQQSSFAELALDDKFDLIIGSDVIYESGMGVLVAYVLSHRLGKGAQALICCAVRDKDYFKQFEDTLQKLNLDFQKKNMEPEQTDYKLTFIRNHDYEGGYIMYTIKSQEKEN